MGIFSSLLGGGEWERSCPVCGLDAGSKPGGVTNFWGGALFQDNQQHQLAVREYNRLVADNPGHFVCWPAVVDMYVSRQALIEYRQVWENKHPGNQGPVWQDITTMLDGKASHNPVIF